MESSNLGLRTHRIQNVNYSKTEKRYGLNPNTLLCVCGEIFDPYDFKAYSTHRRLAPPTNNLFIDQFPKGVYNSRISKGRRVEVA